MRLIDADALEDYIESDESGLMSAREFQRDYIECINEMPTVFDVDAVVEKLMKESFQENVDDEPYVMLDDAIEIVKSGILDKTSSVSGLLKILE